MDQVNDSVSSSASNTAQDNNLNAEEVPMKKCLRKERDGIIIQNIQHESSLNSILGTINALKEELKKASELQSKLELRNMKLKEANKDEIYTKLRFENDVENIKRATGEFGEHLSQLQSTVQDIEVNTEYIIESQDSIIKQIMNYLNEKIIKEKCYKEEIAKMETVIEIEIDNDNKLIQDNKLILDKEHDELSALTKQEQELIAVFEQEKSKPPQLQNELQKSRSDKVNLENEFDKLHIQFSEVKEKHNNNKISYESQTQTLEVNLTEERKQTNDLQNKINSFNQKHIKIVEETVQVESELKLLEIEQEEQENIFADLLLKTDKLKANIAQKQEERNSEIISLEEQVKIATERNENLKELNENLRQQLEDKNLVTQDLKNQFSAKKQEQEELIKQIENTRKKNKENSFDYEETINEYKNKIAEAQLRNKEKKEATEVLKKKVEDKQIVISNIRDIIKNKTNKKNSLMQNKITILKSFKDELKSLKQNLQLSTAELEKLQKSRETKIKLAEKNHREKINKIEKEIEQYREKMDTLVKNNNDKLIKERNYLEDCAKTMNLQINEIKTSKENLQEEIAKKIIKILDVSNQNEVVNNKIKLKKTQRESTFKSPNVPTKTRKSRVSFATSTPKTTSKKITKKTLSPIIQKENLNDSYEENYPLTQISMPLIPETKKIEFPISPIRKYQSLTTNFDEKKSTPKNIATSTSVKKPEKLTQNENLDTSEEIFPLTQKNITTNFQKISVSQIPETNKVEFPVSPIGKYISLTADFNKTKKSMPKNIEISTSQTKTWQNVSLWPTDNETSDDGFNKNKNQVTSTQKPNISPILLREKPVYDFIDSEKTGNENKDNSLKNQTKKNKIPHTSKTTKRIWESGNDSSDDSFFGKLEKSKNIQSTMKESSKPTTTVINIDTSISD